MPSTSSPELRLLTSRQMARFVSHGYLQFDRIVPDELNRLFLDELKADKYMGTSTETPTLLYNMWPGLTMRRILRLPRVRAVIESLMGPRPVYMLHAKQPVPPEMVYGFLGWHSDVIVEPGYEFRIHILYFPHDTPREMGGTLLLPGSHFGRVSGGDLMHIQNFLGQKPVVCPGGTMVFCHYNLWHSAQQNSTKTERLMLKIGVRPGSPQTRVWDTSDLGHPDVAKALTWFPPWISGDIVLSGSKRRKFWQYLTTGRFDEIPVYPRLEDEDSELVEDPEPATDVALT